MDFYDWQKQIINYEGNVTVRGGRQTGKSWAVAERIKYLSEKFPESRHLIISASGRQSNYLYEKLKDLIGKSKSNYEGRVTLDHMKRKNGSEIFRYDVGMTGIYIEGLSSIDFIYADEAIHIGKKVWDSIMPMLLEPSKRGLGWITLLSATKGKPKGFFFESFQRDDFLKIQIKSCDVPHADLNFLETERKRLGETMYKVIYEGEFDENATKYFAKEIVERCIKIGFWNLKDIKKEYDYYLGIDPARYGKSKAAFAVSEWRGRDDLAIVYGEELKKSSLIDLKNKTEELDNQIKFRKLFIDDGGFGAGLIDILEKKFRSRLRPMNNNSATLEKGKILKEDLYSNCLRLLEEGKLQLVNQKEIIDGLLDVEVDDEDKIVGTDMSEAIARACWCIKEKNIKPYIISF